MPIGTCATPMKFSQLRRDARVTSSEWWAMLLSGVRVISSSARRRISAASSGARSFGSSWKRRSPVVRERTSSARVRGAAAATIELVTLVTSRPFAEPGVTQLGERLHPQAEHANLQLLHDPLHSLHHLLRRLGGRLQEGECHSCEIRAEIERLGDVDPVADAAARDHRHAADRAHLLDRARRRYPPAGKDLAQAEVAG